MNDCTVRAISLATNRTWDETYSELSDFAQSQGIMPNEVKYIDEYLARRYERICGCRGRYKITVRDFVNQNPIGTYLITMAGHITCAIDGHIYDTFNPLDRYVWGAYRIN